MIKLEEAKPDGRRLCHVKIQPYVKFGEINIIELRNARFQEYKQRIGRREPIKVWYYSSQIHRSRKTDEWEYEKKSV